MKFHLKNLYQDITLIDFKPKRINNYQYMTFKFQMDHVGPPNERERVLYHIANTFERYLKPYDYTNIFVYDMDSTINIHFVNVNKL